MDIRKLADAINAANLSPKEKIEKYFELSNMKEFGGHDAMLPSLMTLEEATSEPTPSNPHHSKTVFSIVVPRSLCNRSGALHGGAVALIFDICTSLSITTVMRDGFWDTGHVSRTLNCTYLRPVAEGSKIWVESEVLHLGKRMGMTRGVIKDENGRICYTCEHGKAALGGSSL